MALWSYVGIGWVRKILCQKVEQVLKRSIYHVQYIDISQLHDTSSTVLHV